MLHLCRCYEERIAATEVQQPKFEAGKNKDLLMLFEDNCETREEPLVS
jgi:hypothetical protein